jgi:hypothetical protein
MHLRWFSCTSSSAASSSGSSSGGVGGSPISNSPFWSRITISDESESTSTSRRKVSTEVDEEEGAVVVVPPPVPVPIPVLPIGVGRRDRWLWNRLRRTPAVLVAARVTRFVPGRMWAGGARSAMVGRLYVMACDVARCGGRGTGCY